MPLAVVGYRIRPRSFVLSVILHGLAIFALAFIPVVYTDTSILRQRVDEPVDEPEKHKIIWYDFRKALPDVQPTERIGDSPEPRGRELSPDTMIAVSPKPDSSKQFIWQPIPKPEIPEDVPAPNIVVRSHTAVFAPPPTPKKQEEIKPNIDAPPAPILNTSPQNPKGDVKRALEAAEAVNIPKPLRKFVAPPSSHQQARLTLPVQTSEIALPNASVTGSAPSLRNPLLDGIGTASLSKGVAPPPNGPPGTSNSNGNGKMDIAAVGLNPGKGPIPDGSRGGQFSRAPNLGEPSGGEVGGVGVGVPGLAVHQDHTPPAPPPQLTRTILYADKIGSIPVSTLSVPLRPASRTIPRAIDLRFQGRDVYTMVIPIENLPRYTGDWILWFAEHEQHPGDRPSVRSPIPLRKVEPLEDPQSGARTEFRIQLTALIRKDGKVESITPLRPLSPGLEKAAIQDLSSWEFKPATRDGVAEDVDVVMEIPFSLPPQLANRAATDEKKPVSVSSH